MAKRGQIVEEQAVEETARSIAQAQAVYEKLMNEIREHCQQVRDLREQAAEMQRSGRTDFQVGVEVKQLLAQVEHFQMLADQKDGIPRMESIRHLEDLQREASDYRQLIQHIQSVLDRQQKELEEAKEEAATRIRQAEERVQETERLLASEIAKLEELEGNIVE